MEQTFNLHNLHLEKLPEGVYLATTEEIPGLVAQGRTVTETVEIAQDVAREVGAARAQLQKYQRVTPIARGPGAA